MRVVITGAAGLLGRHAHVRLHAAVCAARYTREHPPCEVVGLDRAPFADDAALHAALAERYGYPVILSTHPRTRKRLDSLGMPSHQLVQHARPFGFHDYNHLQMHAFCAISDSGTIAEECSILGFPAVTPRDAAGLPHPVPDDYCIRNTSERVVNLILGTARLSNLWDGIRRND